MAGTLVELTAALEQEYRQRRIGLHGLGRALGCSVGDAARALDRAGVPHNPRGRRPRGPDDPERLRGMQKLRAQGWTYRAIAAAYGLTKQRAHQILTRPSNGAPREEKIDSEP